MAVTVINLSDPVSTWVTKTNTIGSHVGDIALLSAGGSDLVTASNNLDSSIGTLSALNTTVKSSLVAAINDIDSIANANLNDSAEMKGLFATYTDSSQQIAFDSAGGQFRIFHSTITSYVFKSRTELKIMNAAGATLKTIYGPGQ
jgi:hypothetical protein